MNIKGIKTKSDHYRFHLKDNFCFTRFLLTYLLSGSRAYFILLHWCESGKHYGLEKPCCIDSVTCVVFLFLFSHFTLTTVNQERVMI